MLQFINAAESLFVSAHRGDQHLQMMALSGATPLKLRVDVAGILSSMPGLGSSESCWVTQTSLTSYWAGSESQKPTTWRHVT